MKKKQLIWRLSIAGALFIAIVAIIIIGVLKYDIKRSYALPERENPSLVIQDGNYYWEGTELEFQDIGFIKTISPLMVYMIPALVLTGPLFLALNRLPPGYLISGILGIQRQRRRNDKVTLRQAPGGIIAVRSWGINRDGYLRSLARTTVWETLSLTADLSPVVNGWHGIYAHRLGAGLSDLDGLVGFFAGATGLVSLSGHIVGHKDNMLRAEKCRVLALLVRSEKNADKVRQHYNCPVFVVANIGQAIENWTLGQEGLFWMQHNDKLISEKIQEKFEHDITQLPEYIDFKVGDAA